MLRMMEDTMVQRFQTEAELDAFAEAIGLMLVEMAQAYAAQDPAWDSIGDSIILNVEQLVTLAKAGMATSGP